MGCYSFCVPGSAAAAPDRWSLINLILSGHFDIVTRLLVLDLFLLLLLLQ
jgi:hypothetical protein